MLWLEGTANFVNPNVCLEIIDGVEKYLHDNDHKDLNEIIGTLILN